MGLPIKEILKAISVEPVMLIYMMCLYYQIPALNSLYLYKVCRTVYKYDKPLCDDLVAAKVNSNNTYEENLVSSEASRWLFYQTLAFVFPSVIITLIYGIYADKRGRRLPLLSPFFGQAMGAGYYLMVAKLESLHVSYMLFGAFMTGFSGGFATIIMASYSHLTTFSSEEYRTVRVVILEGAMGVGTIIGSFTAGQLLDISLDPVRGWVTTFSVIIGLTVISVIYILIRMRSYSMEYRVTDHRESSCLSILKSMRPRPTLRVVCSGFPSLLQLTFVVMFSIWVTGLGKFDVLYTFTQKMGLNRTLYGYYTGYDAGIQAIVGISSSYVLKRRFFWHDSSVAILGMTSSIICLVFLGISGLMGANSTGFQVFWWLSPLVGMFQLLGPTSLRSLASQFVALSDQSKLFSFITGIDGVLQLATSGIYQYGLWPATVDYIPSLSFFISAVLTCVAVMISCVIRFQLRHRVEGHEQLVDS